MEKIMAVGYPADDHINLAATNSGQVLAAVKLDTTVEIMEKTRTIEKHRF